MLYDSALRTRQGGQWRAHGGEDRGGVGSWGETPQRKGPATPGDDEGRRGRDGVGRRESFVTVRTLTSLGARVVPRVAGGAVLSEKRFRRGRVVCVTENLCCHCRLQIIIECHTTLGEALETCIIEYITKIIGSCYRDNNRNKIFLFRLRVSSIR